MATRSATGALADLFEGQKDRLGEYRKAFRPVDCQVGAVFATNIVSRQGAKVAKVKRIS